jgi:hypothetical protein
MKKKDIQIFLSFLIILVALLMIFLIYTYSQPLNATTQNSSQKAVLIAESDQNVQSYISNYNGSAGGVEEINQSYFQSLQLQEPVIYGNLTIQAFPLYAITFNSSLTASSVLVIVGDNQILRVFPVIGIAK